MYFNLSHSRDGFGTPSKNSPSRKPLLSPSEITPFSTSSETLNLFDNEPIRRNENIQIPMGYSRSAYTSHPHTPKSVKSGFFPGPGKCLSLGGEATGGGVRTMKEYEDGLQDLKKENFNLKLRIYFLEERLGGGTASPRGANEHLQSNIDLKVQCETLKQELFKKSTLLSQASGAIEKLESQLVAAASEWDQERATLKNKLKQLEDDLMDANCQIDAAAKLDFSLSTCSETSTPKKMLMSVTSDEELLYELEAEMKRRPEETQKRGAAKRLDFSTVDNNDGRVLELERHIEELAIMIGDTEACLQQAKGDLDEKNKIISDLHVKMEAKEQTILDLKQEIEGMSKDLKKSWTENNNGNNNCSSGLILSHGNYTTHSHHLSSSSLDVNNGYNLQVVTQTLHIPPTEDTFSNAEVDHLKREMQKLREYLKTSMQERKLLLKKIGSLIERVAEEQQRWTSESKGVQCDNSSSEVDFLPDPSALDLGGSSLECSPVRRDSSFENVISQLTSKLANNDLSNADFNVYMLQELEEEAAEKDRIIADQADIIEEYKHELLRLRSDKTSSKRSYRRKPAWVKEANISENEEWSEPDVVAARQRIGQLSRWTLRGGDEGSTDRDDRMNTNS